jgi:eukaryotic-like serine/threonine-protein kinase
MTVPDRLLGGRYEVGELLGYGGMAEVHRGRDRRLGREVAIKMLRTDLARDQTFQMRFRREAQNAASLNHPAIAAIYDTGEERSPSGEPLPYIVMEFVNGRTLKEVLAAEQRVQPRRALEITADICAALDFSHRHGIIHRDVKPGNVMITPNGQVKVMDFGIARDLASGATTMTQTSAVIGTAQYLSPEQARGELVDARSDVYATGCVLFELLCGHPPFVGDSPVAVAYQHVREDPPLVSSINPDVGPDIDAVAMKALAKNPANRYQSAAEMRADLLRAAAGRPVLATPVMPDSETALLGGAGGPAQVGDTDRRRASTWVLIALGVLGVLAVIALIVGLIMASQAGDDPVAVPDLIGMPEDEAIETLEREGLVPERGDSVSALDTGCTEDRVAEQEPTPDVGTVPPGSTVTYRMCVGPEAFDMPNVVGSTEAAATSQLEALGLVVTAEERDSSDQAGIVVATDPEAAELVSEGDQVTIYVSLGNLQGVPDVLGDAENTAIARLQERGFQVESVPSSDDPDSPDQVGTVAGQSPDPGEELEEGGTVTIFIYPPGADLTATISNPDEDNRVTVQWDNGIYGGVTIDWGDGTDPGTFPSADEQSHVYEDEGTFTITVQAIDHPERQEQRTVTIEIDED